MLDQSIVLVMGINMLLGWSFYIIHKAGLITFGTAGFMAIGAYGASYVTVEYGVPFVIGLLVATAAGAVSGLLLGLPALRVKGLHLALVTIGFGFVIQTVFASLDVVGGAVGYYGMSGTTLAWVYGCVVVIGLIIWRIEHSRLGWGLRAMQVNETVASTLGIRKRYLKLFAFSAGCAIAGLAGALQAQYLLFISPEQFGFFVSIWPAFFVVIGGSQTMIGPMIGAVLVTLVPEFVRPLEDSRELAFASIVVLLLAVRPQGLWTESMSVRIGDWLARARSGPGRRRSSGVDQQAEVV